MASGLHMSVLQNEVIFVGRGYLEDDSDKHLRNDPSFQKHIETIRRTKTLFKCCCLFFVGQLQQARNEMMDSEFLLLKQFNASLLLLTLLSLSSLLKISF